MSSGSNSIKKLVPPTVRAGLGEALDKAKKLPKDSQSVRQTWRNLAPVLVRRSLLLKTGKPTVCAVFAGRNDDFVPDNEARIRAVIEWNSKVLSDEVIFVEWNPLADRPLLSLALTRDYPNVRCYVVPRELHDTVSTNPRMPVMEYFAKNVGMYLNSGLDVGVLRSISAVLLLNIGVQARFP